MVIKEWKGLRDSEADPSSPHLPPSALHRYIGLHDASPLQMLLSKRIFADKNKRYKTNGGEPSSNGSQAPSSGGSQGAAGRSYRSQVPAYTHTLHVPHRPTPYFTTQRHTLVPFSCQWLLTHSCLPRVTRSTSSARRTGSTWAACPAVPAACSATMATRS